MRSKTAMRRARSSADGSLPGMLDHEPVVTATMAISRRRALSAAAISFGGGRLVLQQADGAERDFAEISLDAHV